MQLDEKSKSSRWLKRIGFAGFLFFLIKGLAWIAIAYFSGMGLLTTCN
jgi:hypothetical protein